MAKQTTLDLNGPILRFTDNPKSVSVCTGGTATFTGFATAIFLTGISTDSPNSPVNPATNTGTIVYRWYDDNGPLTDSANVVGSATTVLTVSNIPSTRNIYLTADYVPSAYGLPGVAVTVGSARSTGNAINEFGQVYSSNPAILTIFPNITITSQPLDKSIVENKSTTFTVEAELTDGSDPSLLSYQWYVNCGIATDGVVDYVPICPGTIISEPIIDITNESTGQKTAVNFGNGLTYDNFEPGIVYTLVPRGNIAATLRLSGGKGGSETRTGNRGGFGGYSQGKFTFIRNQKYKLMVGARGDDTDTPPAFSSIFQGFGGGSLGNAAARASGGGNKSTTYGVAGGGAQGGGYTGLFKDTILQSNSIIIAGGGGGANRDPGQGASGGGASGLRDGTNQEFISGGRIADSATQISGGKGGLGGNNGSALKGGDGTDSLSSAGGGGGYFGGGGGGPVGIGGGGSGYLNPTLINDGIFATLATGTFPGDFSGGGFNGRDNGRFQIIGIGTAGSSGFYRNTISGAKTKTLTIASATLGPQSVYCKVSHPTACNSPVTSRTAEFNTIAAKGIIRFESIGLTDTASITEWDLTSQGPYEITYDSVNNSNVFVSFYPTEKDVEVNIQMYGKKGNSNGSFQGGEGGFSSINLTLEKNVEYVITGLFDAVGAPAIYRKGTLLAIVGGGGDAGIGGRGGNGGGIGIAGAAGQGSNAGAGGDVFTVGTLPENGYWYGSYNGTILPPETINPQPLGGGRITPCTRGDYWRNLGFAACADVGTVRFRRQNGNEVTNTSQIVRGFKSGLVMNNNRGRAISNGGNGGAGQNGGAGGSQGGGGGGSGYTNGTATLISTQQGGGKGVARVVISAS